MIIIEKRLQVTALKASNLELAPNALQCKPVKVATLGKIAKKQLFHIGLKLFATLLKDSYLVQSIVILDKIVNSNSINAIKNQPERLIIAKELKPYWLS